MGDGACAAILTTLATSAGTVPVMTVEVVGYGAGHMDLETEGRRLPQL